jgi:RNA polymerase sigma-70 factor (ECF subfamily)
MVQGTGDKDLNASAVLLGDFQVSAARPAAKREADPVVSGNTTVILQRRDSLQKATAEMTDEELFQRVVTGQREYLGVLVERYENSLFSLLVHMTGGDRSHADDLFQETFLRAVQSGASFDPTKRFKAWISTIAVNLVRDDARRKKRRSEVHHDDDEERGPKTLPAKGEGPEAQALRNDEARKIKRILQELTEKEREVVLLHFYEDMTLVETAEALAIPVGTVKSRLHGALTRLKGLLEHAS